MKRYVSALLLVVLGACGPINPPDPPPSQTVRLSFVVCSPVPCSQGGEYVQGAQITLSEGHVPLTTNEYGFADTTVKRDSTHPVKVVAEGYEEKSFSITVPARMNRDVILIPTVPPMTRLRTDGRFFADEAGTYRPLWVSGLTLLVKDAAQQTAFLRWAKSVGLNGVRVFAGALPWANQTPDGAVSALPDALKRAEQQGLRLYVVANTESGTGYDVPAHTSVVSSICANAVNCTLEIANEYYHSTQSSQVQDVAWLQSLALQIVPASLIWATGAAEVDEGADYPAQAGSFSTAHLDRSRDKWNQVRRVREIFGIAEGTGKPAMSGEPIGAAEQSVPGRREADPDFFFAYGALCRLFEIGCVFHSEQGLQADPHTDNQQACAQSYVEGFKALDTVDRLTYKNAGWTDSPVKGFTGAVRVYSGVVGDRGYSVVVGAEAGLSIEWQNGWSVQETLADRGEVKVYRIRRGGQ